MSYTIKVVRASEDTTKAEFEVKNFRFWKEKCLMLDNLQKYTETVQACERAIALKPLRRNALLWNTRGDALLKLRNYLSAASSYNQVLKFYPTNSSVLTKKCRASSKIGSYEDALSECEKALRFNSNWGKVKPQNAWYNRGLASKGLKKYDDAIASFERAILINPNYSLAFAQKCQTLSDLKNYSDAIEACDIAISKINGDWEDLSPAIAFQNKAQILVKLEQLPDAENVYKQALKIDQKNENLWYEQGKIQQKLERYNEALASYKIAVKIKPNYSQALARQAETQNKLKNYQLALEISDKALAGDKVWKDTTLDYIWVQRSTALANLKQYKEAIIDAQKAIALNENNAEAWNNKAVSLWNLGKYKQAELASRYAVTTDDKYAQGWFNRGRILSSLKQYSAAVNAYQKALNSNIPRSDSDTRAMILTNQGVVHWHLGRYGTALNSINTATQISPQLFEVWYNQGVILLNLKKFNLALKAYNKANTIKPNHHIVWAGIAMAHKGNKNYQKALQAIDTALNINPDYAIAKQQREIIVTAIQTKE